MEGGGRGLCQRAGGRKLLKVLKVKVSHYFSVFWSFVFQNNA